MFFFNEPAVNNLKKLLNDTSSFKMIVLWGEKGNGKTFAIHSALKNSPVKIKDFVFSEENIASFEMTENLSIPVDDEDAFLIQYSQLLKEDYCLIFRNMELCDADSQRILYRLMKLPYT